MAVINTIDLDYLLNHPKWSATLLALLSYILYSMGLAFYRLYLSPIAKFPGPKLAALTSWYQCYYDVYKKGTYMFEIDRMHEKYGPIVRINPWELHSNDPEFFDVLYAGTSKRRDKWPISVKGFGNPNATFATTEHDHHRMRRAILNPYFSKKSVSKLEYMICDYVNIMCARFREYQKSQKPLSVRYPFAALTLDIITQYCFAQSYECLTHADFEKSWSDANDQLVKGCHVAWHFPWLLPIMMGLPDRLLLKLNPFVEGVIRIQKGLEKRITAVMKQDSKESLVDHSTVFHEILHSDALPYEKSLRRLVEEGQVFVSAGQMTTADTLEVTCYHLLKNPETLAKLKKELDNAMPDTQILSWQKLEQLPYLSAVVNEGIRITCPVVTRSQRIAPDEALTCQGYTIPPGTPVSTSLYFMCLRNEKYFPEGDKFKPERWLVPPEQRRILDKYFAPFGKGSRMCLGITLAMAELYITLAAVFRRFELELYETKPEDVEICHDYFVPMFREGSTRVRVLVKG